MISAETTTVLLAAVGGGLLLLAFFIYRLVRLMKQSVVRRLDLAASTVLRLEETGPIELHLEARGLRQPPPLEISLHDRSMGGEVEIRPIRLRSRVAGPRKARVSLLAFSIDHAGEYELRVDGAEDLEFASSSALILSRPVRGRVFVHVLGIVAGSLLLLFGLLSFLLTF